MVESSFHRPVVSREARSEQELGTDLSPITSVSCGYDPFGAVQTSKDAFGTTTVLRRADGSVRKTILPDGRTVVSDPPDKYDTAGKTTRADGTTVSTPTNPLGQVASVSGAGTAPMTFGINPLTGQQTSLTTFTGSTFNSGTAAETSWKFDDATGRMLSKSYDGTATNASDIAYGYGGDPADVFHRTEANIKTITRPGSIETLAYNDGGNSTPATGEVRSASFQNNGTLESAYSFARDIFGRLSSVQQTAGGTQTVDYAYTADGQLQSESQPWAGTYMAVDYGYYATTGTTGPANALENVSLEDGGNTVVGQTYTYDANTRRLETVSGAGLTDTYAYRSNTDLVASLTSSNNITTSYQYEPNTGRLQSISAYCGTTTVYRISYEYNANDQRVGATETRLLPDDTTQTRTYRFEYDAQDHLTVYEVKDASGTVIADRSFTYTYDSLGNRTGTAFAVNALNQYTKFANSTAFTYDARGNTTAAPGLSMSYDSQDRLIQVVNGAVTAKYGYDYMGRRTSKALYVTGQSQPYETRTFAYDGWNLIAEFVTDATHTTPTLARAYTWGLSLGGGVGGLLSVRDYLAPGGAQTYKPFFDGNGNVMGLTDDTGAVVARYEYDPYGKLLSATGPAADACPFRSATMYYDVETGLYYVKMRYYSPDLQRWINRDPIEENGGVNMYVYCGDDPVNGFDPTGLDPSRYDVSRDRYDSLMATLGDLERRKDYDASQGGSNQRWLWEQVQLVKGQIPSAWNAVVGASLEGISTPMKGPNRYAFVTKTYEQLRKSGVSQNWAKLSVSGDPLVTSLADQWRTVGLDPAKTRVVDYKETRGLSIPLLSDGTSNWYMLPTAVANGDGQLVQVGYRYLRYETGALGQEFENLEKIALSGVFVMQVLSARPVVFGNGLQDTAITPLNPVRSDQVVEAAGSELVARAGPRGVDPLHHNANVLVRDAKGNIIQHERFVSGKMTPAEAALPFPKNTLSSHTEFRAVGRTSLEPRQTMTVTGQLPPCNSCKGAMNRAANETGATIRYRWREDGVTQNWYAGD